MKTLAFNKKALFNYEVLEEYDAGLVLMGWEVKSIKNARISLKESYVTLRDNEAWLIGAHITKWPGMGKADIGIETRERKILLHAGELARIKLELNTQGTTLIPLDMHLERNIVKLKLALARGKKKYDKRQKLKEIDQKRQIDRDLKHYQLK